MPRLARLVLPDVALHVVQRGHNRQACFREDTDRMVYLVLLRDGIKKSRCVLHAYCLMTNHVHLLLTPPDASACGILMRNLGQRYVQYFNSRYDRRGTLWEGRPYSCLVDSTKYVLGCYRYIELNPVRAEMVASAAAYKWSSYEANGGGSDDPLVSPHTEYLALGNDPHARREAYRQLFPAADDPDFLAEIRDATNGGYPLVGNNLKSRLSDVSKRRLKRAKPGPHADGDSPGNTLTRDLPF